MSTITSIYNEETEDRGQHKPLLPNDSSQSPAIIKRYKQMKLYVDYRIQSPMFFLCAASFLLIGLNVFVMPTVLKLPWIVIISTLLLPGYVVAGRLLFYLDKIELVHKLNFLSSETTKILGFETQYKQTFPTHPDEKLKETFACYLLTPIGPIAGLLYVSNFHLSFSSLNHPSSLTPPSDLHTWSFFKVMLPLQNIKSISPVIMAESSLEEHIIQIETIDRGHDLWTFTGFENCEKVSTFLNIECLRSDVVNEAAMGE